MMLGKIHLGQTEQDPGDRLGAKGLKDEPFGAQASPFPSVIRHPSLAGRKGER